MERKPKKTGIRVDRWVKAHLPTLTGRHIDEAIEAGLVVDVIGKRVSKGDRIGPEDRLDLSALENHLAALRQTAWGGEEVPVIADSASEWLVDKPAGIPCHPIGLFDWNTLTHWGLAQLSSLSQEFPEPQPTITPHRLDTGTSGLVVVAKTQRSYQMWRERFNSKRVEKSYYAWCWGLPEWNARVVDSALAHEASDARKMCVVDGAKSCRGPRLPAWSSVTVVARDLDRNVSLVHVTCRTGVTHQVRVHLASLGFPLLGDELYDASLADRSLTFSFHALRAVSLKWPEGEASLEQVNPFPFPPHSVR